MKTKESIEQRIKEIENDSRYQLGLKHPANVQINAPLAMIQVALESECSILKWVLKDG